MFLHVVLTGFWILVHFISRNWNNLPNREHWSNGGGGGKTYKITYPNPI